MIRPTSSGQAAITSFVVIAQRRLSLSSSDVDVLNLDAVHSLYGQVLPFPRQWGLLPDSAKFPTTLPPPCSLLLFPSQQPLCPWQCVNGSRCLLQLTRAMRLLATPRSIRVGLVLADSPQWEPSPIDRRLPGAGSVTRSRTKTSTQSPVRMGRGVSVRSTSVIAAIADPGDR